MRERIEVRKINRTTTAAGGQSVTYEKFADAWAQFIPRIGNERFFAHRLEEVVEAVFKTRFIIGLHPEMRIVHQGIIWEIHSIIPMNGEKFFQEIRAMKGVGS